MFNGDISSIMLLLIGKESHWTPYIVLIMVLIHKWDTIEKYIKTISLFNKHQYELHGKIIYNIKDAYMFGDLSTHMWAVLYNIHQTIKTKHLPIKKVKSVEFPCNKAFERGEYVHIPSDSDKIWVTDDIYCCVKMNVKEQKFKSEDPRGPNEVTSEVEVNEIVITLTSITSIDNTIQYIKHVTEQYNNHIKTKDNKQLFIIKPICPRKDQIMCPVELPFKSSKTFDNLFFEGKENLIARLDTFMNRDKYKILGLPETLGLLFYGEPGTGKTSAIKAVANYLSMHLIIVPMNNIKNKQQLEELFYTENREIHYPNSKRIYVFEEIDCNGWENIITDRKLIQKEKDTEASHNSTEKSITNVVEALTDSIKNSIEPKKKKDDSDDNLTLGAILEVLDGIIETPGRVIIFTTNHKDKIDPALLRPGRIDMQIEFKKLRGTHINQIFEKWYGYPISNESVDLIPDYKFTQAEVSQLLFKHDKDSNAFLKDISSTLD